MAEAVVVGAGPNGLAAAITLARAGWKVVLFEAAATVGGGMRTAALTEPGFAHDVCSAIHPLALASPAFADLPLHDHGLEWSHPAAPLAHPLDGGRAAILERSVADTARALGDDGRAYARLFDPLVERGPAIVDATLSPLRVPRAPLTLARFGVNAIRPARALARARFASDEARALLAGAAGHSMLSLDAPATAGYGMLLMLLGHLVGWPMAAGGSQALADALAALLIASGGEIVTDHEVTSLRALPPADATVLDVTPRQLLAIAGDDVPTRYASRLSRFRYGPGVCKVDWALDGPIPWTSPDVARAATVHVGGTLDEVAASEAAVVAGRHPERPFVLLVQPSGFDPSRAPVGKHTAWAYCHVPSGSDVDQTAAIEAQVERFAPGFRDQIRACHTMTPAQMEGYNANYVGGDINGGAGDLRQLVTRPAVSARPWRTPIPGVYLCSSSTPPGGGVHGMCGWHAAQTVLRDHRGQQ
ncbi:MAG: NAD(P)/FAD-dependent oxidoreductase [Acidimicrobiia bacterium]